jgi:tryptophan-rich sensory protein
MRNIRYILLSICLILPLAIGGLSGYLTVSGLNGWYTTLIKPSFNPPNYVFGPVWTLLYLLMGVSIYMIRTAEHPLRKNATIIFAIQLVLNFWWSIIFFQMERPLAALVEIIVMWFSILYMIVSFRRIKPLAAYLQIPYLLWVSFATLLTASIWWLNR